jgi:hypothetical protein
VRLLELAHEDAVSDLGASLLFGVVFVRIAPARSGGNSVHGVLEVFETLVCVFELDALPGALPLVLGKLCELSSCEGVTVGNLDLDLSALRA